MLKAIENELTAVDDRTFRFSLKKPFRKLLVALGKVGTPSCFILPARIAATDPFKPIDEYVGSGPMRLVRNEWIPSARAVFAPRHDRGLCGSRLGYGHRTPVAEIAAGQGGWQMYHTWQAGGVCIDTTNKIIRANGQLAVNGWPNIPQVEAELAARFEAQTLDQEKTIARQLNKAVLDHALHAPLGFFLKHHLAQQRDRDRKGSAAFLLGVGNKTT
jgi:hypothetical protein